MNGLQLANIAMSVYLAEPESEIDIVASSKTHTVDFCSSDSVRVPGAKNPAIFHMRAGLDKVYSMTGEIQDVKDYAIESIKDEIGFYKEDLVEALERSRDGL